MLFEFRYIVTDFSSEHNSESAGDDVSAEERHNLEDNVTSVPEKINADRKDFPFFDEDGECDSQENQRSQSAILVTKDKIPTEGNVLFPSFFT